MPPAKPRSFVITALVLIAAAALLLVAGGSRAGAVQAPPRPGQAGAPQSAAGQVIDLTAEIKIGVGAPLTGGLAWLGLEVLHSVEMAVADAAPDGLFLNGITYTIQIIGANDDCSLAGGQAAASQLITAGVSAVVGHVCSGSTLWAAPIYDNYGVPMVSPASTNVAITHQGYSTTFRVISADDAPPRLAAEFAYRYSGARHTAIADVMYGGYYPFLGDSFQQAFEGWGGQLAARALITDTSYFTATLQALKLLGVDLIYLTETEAPTAAEFGRIAASLGMQAVPILFNPMTEDYYPRDQYSAALGADAAGDIIVMSYRNPALMPGWQTFRDAYFSAYGSEPHTYGAFAYDAARINLEAIVRANSPDPSAIRAEIAATSHYAGVVGTYIGFDEFGDVIPQWAWLERFNGASWYILTPTLVDIPLAAKG